MHDFVIEEHEQIIQEFVKAKNIAISFRKAGVYTVHRLKAGCACKGHEVLEKSIKEKTKERITIPPSVNIEGLYGLIGHWCETEEPSTGKVSVELKGVYLSEFGVQHIQDLIEIGIHPLLEHRNIVGLSIALVQIMQMDTRYLNTISEMEKQWSNYFLTGDYDIHDMLDMKPEGATKNHIIDQKRAAELFTQLNKQLVTVKNENRQPTNGSLSNEFSYIRHGAQIHYPIYMYEHEKGKSLVLNVIQADYELMMFEPTSQKPILFQSFAEYSDWYMEKAIHMKSTFQYIESALNLYFDNQICATIIEDAIKEYSFLIDKGVIKIEEGKLIGCNRFSVGANDAALFFYRQLKSEARKVEQEQEGITLTMPLKWKDNYELYQRLLNETYKIPYTKVKVANATLVDNARKFLWHLSVDNETREFVKSLNAK